MEISVVVEKVAGNGFRATSFAPAPMVAEGRTRDEALSQLQTQIQGRLSGAEVVQFHVPLAGESHPWKALRGSWRDYPDAAELDENVREYRRQVDADADRP